MSNLIYQENYKEDEKQTKNQAHIVINLQSPSQIKWKNEDELLINKSKQLYSYNSKTRDITKIHKLKTNEIFGIKNNEIIYCSWENYKIKNPDETATKINITNNSEKKLKTIETNKTIKPLNCSEETIYAVTSNPILETKFYKIRDKNTVEIDILPSRIGLNYDFLPISENIYEEIKCLENIEAEDISQLSFSPNKKKVAITDNDGLITVINNFNCN